MDFGRNDVTTADKILEYLKTSELSIEQKNEIDIKITQRDAIVAKSKSKAVDQLPPTIDTYVEIDGKYIFRNNQALEYINFGENRLKEYKVLLTHLPSIEKMTICYKSEFKLQRDDKKILLKLIETGKLLQ